MKVTVWDFDPVMVSFFNIQLHWYGILFASAISIGFLIMRRIYCNEGISLKSLDPLFLYCVVGIVVGARLAHCFFYDPHYYFNNIIKVFAIWEGGLASHGGGLGVFAAVYMYSKQYDFKWLWLIDRLTIPTALFGFFVRVANFLNSEILGLPSSVPWAIVFKRIDNVPRHPVQLYEGFVYLLIFICLFIAYRFTNIKLALGRLSGFFLCAVFSARFLLEFFKVKQAGYTLMLPLTTGQLLSLPFIIIGLYLLFISKIEI